VIISVLVCDILINVSLQTSALVGPLYLMQNYNFVLVLHLVRYPEGTAHTEVVMKQNY
jgi:hypothetical protein